MKSNKAQSVVILIINVLGSICLFYFAFVYLTHSTVIQNPNAMLPAQMWDLAGMILTFGTIPLCIANYFGFRSVKAERSGLKFLSFLPSAICIAVAAHYWITSLL